MLRDPKPASPAEGGAQPAQEVETRAESEQEHRPILLEVQRNTRAKENRLLSSLRRKKNIGEFKLGPGKKNYDAGKWKRERE